MLSIHLPQAHPHSTICCVQASAAPPARLLPPAQGCTITCDWPKVQDTVPGCAYKSIQSIFKVSSWPCLMLEALFQLARRLM